MVPADGVHEAVDRNITFAQLDHLHSKYPGTGDADTNRLEWLTGQHRDTYASILGHSGMQLYMAAAESHSLVRVRYNLVQSMIAPCNPTFPAAYTQSSELKDAGQKTDKPAV